MFSFFRSGGAEAAIAKLAALDKSMAIIEFALDGTILTANDNCLSVLGYRLDEIVGKRHSMLVEAAYRDSADYRRFWEALAKGDYQAAQFKRIGKGGKEVWIEASYNPILNRHGKPIKVMKFATDVTRQKMEFADLRGQVEAIGKSQAVIEFALDGTILTANQNFLNAMGYTLAEIRGKHHGIFVDPRYRQSEDYRRFWANLNHGEFHAGQFKRFGKGGAEVWIEASYNPILDLNGKLCKVVKYATDITAQVTRLAGLKTSLDQSFNDIALAVDQSADQARRAVDSVHSTTGQIQSMAASAEELAASVRQIADTVARSNTASELAHTQTVQADSAIQRLTATSTAMGGIVALIRNIAGQINLLALNATIESARAGEAGKGFAVVAGEVKNLAQQAANATNQIAQEIEQLQTVSTDVATALGNIGHAIASLREFASATASAMEEQSTVTQELSSGMQGTATTIVAINDNMNEISNAVGQVAHAVKDTRSAAQILVRQSDAG